MKNLCVSKIIKSTPFVLGLVLSFPSISEADIAPASTAVPITTDPLVKTQPPAGSPVAKHGQLSVLGTHLVDAHGQTVQLKGMSAFEPNLQFCNPSSIEWLCKNWHISLFRATMSVKNYIQNPEAMTTKVDEIVDNCIKQGIYVLIDYHLGELNSPGDLEAWKRFFDMMSKKYANLPNVIYEVWNEPNGKDTWEKDIKPRMEQITKVIRANDTRNIILAPSPSWDQRLNEAASDPLADKNMMYSLHFYSGTHKQDIRDVAEAALEKGLPIFVSEWGVSNAYGGGGNDHKVYLEEADRWIAWLDKNQISWANWSLGDRDESSAALKPGAPLDGGWKDEQLTASGKYVRNLLLRESVSKNTP